MPNYYGEILQAYWTPTNKLWALRLKTAHVLFDKIPSAVMEFCTFKCYKATSANHATALIEGNLYVDPLPLHEMAMRVTVKSKPVGTFTLPNDQEIQAESQADKVWLNNDGTIDVLNLHARKVRESQVNVVHRFAVPWECEHWRGGRLVKTQRAVTVNQWNAVRVVLKINVATRRYGTLDGEVLTYEDMKGNKVIVRPTMADRNIPEISLPSNQGLRKRR